jgi:hypothetical protein
VVRFLLLLLLLLLQLLLLLLLPPQGPMLIWLQHALHAAGGQARTLHPAASARHGCSAAHPASTQQHGPGSQTAAAEQQHDAFHSEHSTCSIMLGLLLLQGLHKHELEWSAAVGKRT